MISERLKSLTELIKSCRLLADCGCDHGYTCIEAVKTGKALFAVGSDLRTHPLECAQKNIEAEGLTGRIRLIRSDGLEAYDFCPDCLVITGMGGRLICDILKKYISQGHKLSDIPQILLGPQSDTDLLRYFILSGTDCRIGNEFTLYDNGKYYTILDIEPGNEIQGYSESEFLFGRYHAAETQSRFAGSLLQQEKIINDALLLCSAGETERSRKKSAELRHILDILKSMASKEMH